MEFDDKPVGDNSPSMDSAAQQIVLQAQTVDAVGEEEELEDSHHCAKCRLIFTSLEDYVKHKLDKDNCKVTYIRDRRLKLPQIVQRHDKPPSIQTGLTGRRRGRPPKQPQTGEQKLPAKTAPRVPKGHNESNIIERTEYACEKCAKVFRREATLRQHVSYEHEGVYINSDGEEEERSKVTADTEVKGQTATSKAPHMESRSNTHIVMQTVIHEADIESSVLIPVNMDNEQLVTEDNESMVSITMVMSSDADAGSVPVVAGGDNWTCELCKAEFKNSGALKAHMLTHTDTRDFCCTWPGCDFSFKTKGSLIRHTRRHTGDRPYKCNLCGRGFGESGALTRHLKSRYPCSTKSDSELPRYGKTLPFKNSTQNSAEEQESVIELQQAEVLVNQAVDQEQEEKGDVNHVTMLIDVGEGTSETGEPVSEETLTPNQSCWVCKTTFECDEDLKEHIKTSHLEDMGFRCGLCNYATSSRPQLDLHLQVTHQVPLQANREDYKVSDIKDDSVVMMLHPDDLQDDLGDQGQGHEMSSESVFEAGEPVHIVTAEEVAQSTSLIIDTHETTSHDTDNQSCILEYTEVSQEELASHSVVQVDEVTNQELDNNTELANMNDDIQQEIGEVSQSDSSVVLETMTTQSHDVDLANESMVISMGTNEELEELAEVDKIIEVSMEECAEISNDEQEIQDEQTQDTREGEAAIAIQQLLALNESKPPERGEGDKTIHKCAVCSRTFTAARYLKLHIRTHTGERPFKCPECSKSFMNRDTLQKHRATHGNERSYKCGECGKLFKRIGHVREHFKVHSAERPYHCYVCSKGFKSSNACKVHLRTHFDLLPWECEYCHRRFREKASRDRHVRCHTGERPYQCQQCGKCFTEHGTLSRHLKAKVPCAERGRPPLLRNNPGVTIETSIQAEHTMQESISLDQISPLATSQGYIVQAADPNQQDVDSSELLMVAEDGLEASQFIEVVADGQTEHLVDQDDKSGYLLVKHGDSVMLINRITGETLAPLATEGDDNVLTYLQAYPQDGNLDQGASQTSQPIIQAVAMVPSDDLQVTLQDSNIAMVTEQME